MDGLQVIGVLRVPKTEPSDRYMLRERIYFRELAHVIMDAGKSNILEMD